MQGVLFVAESGCGEKAPLDAGTAVGGKDAEGVAVIAVGVKDGASAQGDPVVPAVDREVDKPMGKGGVAEKDEEGIKWLKHYSSMQSILIVGDGDFSFSLSLATAFGSGQNLVATSLDTYEDLTKKYVKAESNVTELKSLGAAVLHGVDAKEMKLHPFLKMRRFDRIVFNFPHAGFDGKEDDLHMINKHKQLVNGFFCNARHLLRPYGETHLSHKTGLPYDAWDIEQLAYQSCFTMVEKVDFCKQDYPGYNQKRGDKAKCDQPFALGPCCTFKFCIGDVKKLKKVRANRIDSIPSLGGSGSYPGILVTDMRPSDLHPPAPAWPRPHFPPVNALHIPIAFEPYHLGVNQMEHPGFPVNFYGTDRAPHFNSWGMVRPVCSIPGSPQNVLLTPGGIPPPMRIPNTTLIAPPEHPWYQEGPPVELLRRGGYSFPEREYQRSLQREYEIHRQLMPGGSSLGYSVFLEHRYMESVQRRERLEMLINFYGKQ